MISNYDENYEAIKNEFYNLYNNVLNINDSLNYHNNTIKDLYLNENSTLNLLNRYYSNQNNHPIGSHSNSLLYLFNNTFNQWSREQQNQFQTINRYISQLDSIKAKFDRLDSGLANSNDSFRLKNEIFKDVQQQFDNRVNQFDIPIINIQNSFHSLIQTLNSNLNDSSALLQNQINFISPVSHLRNQTQQYNNTNNNNNNNNNLVRNTLPQIPKPTPSRPIYNPPQVYSPPPPTPQQVYSPPIPNNNNPYQQYYPPTPQQPQQPYQPQQVNTNPSVPPKKTAKSSLRQIERPAPIELPDSTFIEPEIKRKPGDFLKDPKAPRYVPEKVEPISKRSDTLSHHSMSLSESRAHAMAHKPAPLPPPSLNR